MMTKIKAIIHFVFLFTWYIVYATRLEFHSFEPNFMEVDASGERMASRHWKASGSTVVNNNFVRLTPDRQSKKGALWSRKALGVPAFSAMFKFRIAGKGEKFFGDGLAVWIVQSSSYIEGSLHGFQDKFVGIAIIFDTFKNTENLSAHRDVTVLINDGEKTWEMMTEDVKGCSMNFRYHSERGDFSVTDSTRAKIIVNDTSLKLAVDPKNSGEWTDCVDLENLALPKGWASSAYVGLTASTGQLSDNHDVLSFVTYSDSQVMAEAESTSEKKKMYKVNSEAGLEERINSIEIALNDLMESARDQDHHFEHQVVLFKENIQNLISKLNEREDTSESRIGNLEDIIKKEVDGAVSEKLDMLEKKMKSNVHRNILSAEDKASSKITSVDTSLPKESVRARSSGGWKLPFVLLVCVIGIAGYFQYIYFKKTFF